MSNRYPNAISFVAYRRMQHMFFFLAEASLLILVLLPACGPGAKSFKSVSPSDEWREFEGTWTATGTRNSIHLGNSRRASISTLDGSLVLAGPSRPGVGFRSEAIVFSDTATGLVGRAVWTDAHGDQVYSELRGEGTAKSNKITGTFLSGTGRYSGVEGTYDFSWRFILENEEGGFQGQSMGLHGRVRLDSQRAAAPEGVPRS